MDDGRSLPRSHAVTSRILLLAIGAILLGIAATAQAQAPQPGLANGFEVDGTLAANSPGGSIGMGTDWLEGLPGPGSSVLFPDGIPKDPLVTWHFIDFIESADQDVFGGRAKVYDDPNTYVWKTGSVPPKDDVQNGLIHLSRDAAGNYWMIMAGDRMAINGDSYIDFEFLQKPLTMNADNTFSSAGPHRGRTVGDFLLTVKLRQGGSQAEFFAQEWTPDGKGGYTYVDIPFPAGAAFVAANIDSQVASGFTAFDSNSYGINQFGEAAVNLTAVLPEFGECYAIATVFVRTKSSSSPNAGLKDFIVPFQLNHCLDEDPPRLDCPADVTVPCSQSTDPTVLGFSFVTDNCDDSPEIRHSDTIVPGSCGNEYTILREWTAIDDCGNTTVCTQTITVVDNTPPTILGGPAPVSVQCSGDIPAPDVSQLNVTDDCGTATVRHLGDVSDGNSCPEVITRTYLVDDGCGNTAEFVQLITVRDTTPPDIRVPENITLQCSDNIPPADIGLVSAQDNCGGVRVIHVGDVSDRNSCPEIITRTYRAVDECGNASEAVQLITIDDNTPPEIVGPQDIAVECTDEIPAADVGLVSARDNCGAVTVSHVGDVQDGSNCPKRITRTYRAVDACGNAAEYAQIITVDDTTPPDVAGPGEIEVECRADVPAADIALIRATDNCGPVTITHEGDASDRSTCPETIVRTYRATDSCGNSTNWEQVIVVYDRTPPQVTCPQEITVGCADDVPPPSSRSLSITDNCGDMTVVHMGDFSDRRSCPETISRVYRVTDACGNATECTQKITVLDVTPPEITRGPGPIRVSCRDDVPAPELVLITARDECGVVRVFHAGDQSDGNSCPEQITRTYRVYDECNNFRDFVQVITVDDDIPPRIVFCPPGQTIECPDIPAFGQPTAEDNCDPDPELIVTYEDSLLGSEPWTFSTTRTWVAVDQCGNTSDECAQTITFKCEVDALCTHTQGFWGNYGGKYNGIPTLQLIRAALSSSALVVGTEARSLTIPYPSAMCIIMRLPAGTTPKTLPYNGNSTLQWTDCLPHPKEIPLDNNGKFENVLLGQTIALGLNMRLSPALFLFPLSREFCTQPALPGPDRLFGTPDDILDTNAPIGHYQIDEAVLNAVSTLGLWPTVKGLYDLANRALGGGYTAGATLSQINNAVDAINRGFDGCRFIVECRSKESSPPNPWAAAQTVDEETSGLNAPVPTEFRLGQNYPNPFNPNTRVTIALPVATPWSLTVYNVAGQLVRRFEGSTGGAEFVNVEWDGTDSQGRPVATGLYLYRIQAATFTDVKKMILLK